MNYNQKYLKYKLKYLELKNKNKMIQSGGSEKPKLYLFKADWCPHCRSFAPVWEKLKEKYESKTDFIKYDADKNRNELKKFNVDAFPTVIMQTGGQAIEYVGPRDEESLNTFIKQYI